jgi:hypothetical protein
MPVRRELCSLLIGIILIQIDLLMMSTVMLETCRKA